MSVILPTYNVERFIPSALAELSLQTYEAIEIIIVDDASDDSTPEHVGDYLKDEPRARLIQQESNLGVAAARERGVAESRGSYVWFVDADDTWSRRCVETLVDAVEGDQSDIAVCDAEYVYDAGKRSARMGVPSRSTPFEGSDGFRAVLEGQVRGHLWNKLFSRRLFEGLEYPRIRVHSDLAMVAQLFSRARRISVVQTAMYAYQVRPGSLITSRARREGPLAAVDEIVGRCMSEHADDIAMRRAHEYFRLRFILMPLMREIDMYKAEGEGDARLEARIRDSITWKHVRDLMGRSQWGYACTILAWRWLPGGTSLAASARKAYLSARRRRRRPRSENLDDASPRTSAIARGPIGNESSQ